MIPINIKVEGKRNPRLIYVINALNKHPYTLQVSVEFRFGRECNISYGGEEGGSQFKVPKADFIFEKGDGEYRMNRYKSEGNSVYSVERAIKDEEEFCVAGNFAFDIFEAIFFHLSRYEELKVKFSDYLGDRYAFEKQLLVVVNAVEKVPVVDDLICVFLEKLTAKKIKKGGEKSLSHDIDFITKFKSPFSIFRKIAGHLRHRKSLKGFSFLWQSYMDYLLKGKDGFDTFEWMLSEQGMDKTIYFLVGGNHSADNQYDLEGVVFKRALKLAKERGYKIGIHPSYDSWNRKELITDQKLKLESVVGEEIVCSRQHYLNFDIRETPEILQNFGIQEDSSIGFARHVGYRCGTGFPYFLYDFQNEKAFDVVERPMVFMDVAWLFEIIRNKNLAVPNFGAYYGEFLFHNSTFDEMGARGIAMRDHYLKWFG